MTIRVRPHLSPAIDTTKATIKTSAEILGKSANSKILRNNMKVAGKVEPKYKHAAHHIVAGNSPLGEEAREILRKYHIDINHSSNGVFLPTEKGVSKSSYHPSLHTEKYYRAVTNALKHATDKVSAECILKSIEKGLINGTFKY